MAHSNSLGGFGDLTEAARALAGIRVLVEDTVSPLTTAEASYTVVNAETRRLLVFHLGAGTPSAGDIRVSLLTTADATFLPLVPQKYCTFEMSQGETISFYNTSADTIAISVVEIM